MGKGQKERQGNRQRCEGKRFNKAGIDEWMIGTGLLSWTMLTEGD